MYRANETAEAHQNSYNGYEMFEKQLMKLCYSIDLRTTHCETKDNSKSS